MSKPDKVTATVAMSKTSISSQYLVDLAGEFGGVPLIASGAQEGEDVDFAFDTKDEMDTFMRALGSFNKPDA